MAANGGWRTVEEVCYQWGCWWGAQQNLMSEPLSHLSLVCCDTDEGLLSSRGGTFKVSVECFCGIW